MYLDASALVKRYVAEPGSDLVRSAMQAAERWYICRIGFVETVRAVGLAAGRSATRAVSEEWPSFGVVEVDQELAERAAGLALDEGLRSLDALHLAAALLLPSEETVLATWDRRLHAAAQSHGLSVLPASLP
ncbi:MAG: type II toxin-antitoxin system VapC family toxin [Acidimicrobiales bacterium]